MKRIIKIVKSVTHVEHDSCCGSHFTTSSKEESYYDMSGMSSKKPSKVKIKKRERQWNHKPGWKGKLKGKYWDQSIKS